MEISGVIADKIQQGGSSVTSWMAMQMEDWQEFCTIMKDLAYKFSSSEKKEWETVESLAEHSTCATSYLLSRRVHQRKGEKFVFLFFLETDTKDSMASLSM